MVVPSFKLCLYTNRLSLVAAPVGKAVQRGGLDPESLKQVQLTIFSYLHAIVWYLMADAW